MSIKNNLLVLDQLFYFSTKEQYLSFSWICYKHLNHISLFSLWVSETRIQSDNWIKSVVCLTKDFKQVKHRAVIQVQYISVKIHVVTYTVLYLCMREMLICYVTFRRDLRGRYTLDETALETWKHKALKVFCFIALGKQPSCTKQLFEHYYTADWWWQSTR